MSILVENRRRCTQPLFHLIILPHYPMSQTLVVRSSSWSIQRMVPPFLLNSGENQKECEQCCRSAIVCGGDLLLKLGVGSQLGLVIGVVSPKPQKIQRLALLLQRLQERKLMISFLMLLKSHFSGNMWKNGATFVYSCQSFIVSSTQLKCIGGMPSIVSWNQFYLYFNTQSLLGYRASTDGKFKTAKALVPQCLDSCDLVTIHRFFRKTWRYMDAYE